MLLTVVVASFSRVVSGHRQKIAGLIEGDHATLRTVLACPIGSDDCVVNTTSSLSEVGVGG